MSNIIIIEEKHIPTKLEEHQAMMTESHDEIENAHIIQVLQKGYKLNGKVVRPAMVKVCKK